MRYSYVALGGAAAIAGASAFFQAGCGDSGPDTGGAGGGTSTTSGSGTTAHTTATSTTNGATTTHATTNTTTATATATSTSTGGLVCSGNTPVTLTVINHDAWCSVTVGNNPPSTAAVQTYCVANGAATTLVSAPTNGFTLAAQPWDHTDNDANASTTETPTATTDCIATCCPTANAPNDCPTTDQCP